MNILVCVKQVPDTNEIKIDPVTNTLIRAGVPTIVNTFDQYSLEMAVRLKEKVGGTITLVTMGPQQAEQALKTCLSVGADKAYLVSDRVFGGSDTLATSYILSKAIAKITELEGDFDMIFCGKQAIDGDTGQVGPEIAEFFGASLLTYVSDVDMEDGVLKVKRESDLGYDVYTAEFPLVVTVVKPNFEPRFPTIKSKMQSLKAEITVLNAEDLKVDVNLCGLKGSPTKVKRTFVPVHSKEGIIIKGETAVDATKKLVDLLSENKVM